MCKLLGIYANKDVDFHFSLKGTNKSLRAQSEENPDGWGVAIFSEAGKATLTKAPRKAGADELFNQRAGSGFGRLLIAHVRKATSGNNRYENTHPFEIDGWVFAHNGTIHDKAALESYVTPRLANAIKGDTDSERYFALILSQFETDRVRPRSEGSKVLESLAVSVHRVRDLVGGNGLNFLLSDGEHLYAYKNRRPLYLLERDPETAPEIQFLSRETGALLQWKKRVGEKAVVLASEQITQSEEWEAFCDNELVCIDRDLSIQRRQIR